jgi:hypothetical protein
MSLENIHELIEKNKTSSIFSYEKIWTHPTPMHRKFWTYLLPDSHAYHSTINPIFSFELEEGQFKGFRIFPLLSLRDGVYPLMKYFAINPAPHEIDPVLIVDSKFSSLVPKAWRDRVVLRDLFVKNKILDVQSKELLLLISPDKDSTPKEVFEKEMDKIASQMASFDTVSVLLSSCAFLGEEGHNEDFSWGHKLLKIVFDKLPGKSITILDYKEFQKKNVSELKFHFLNTLQFYFSDSSLLHDLLRRGALPLEKSGEKKEGDVYINISMNHGFVFHQNFSEEEIIMTETLKEKVFKGSVYAAKEENLLSTKEFKDWTLFVAKRIYLLP